MWRGDDRDEQLERVDPFECSEIPFFATVKHVPSLTHTHMHAYELTAKDTCDRAALIQVVLGLSARMTFLVDKVELRRVQFFTAIYSCFAIPR